MYTNVDRFALSFIEQYTEFYCIGLAKLNTKYLKFKLNNKSYCDFTT